MNRIKTTLEAGLVSCCAALALAACAPASERTLVRLEPAPNGSPAREARDSTGPSDSWPGWGGPGGDFKVSVKGLAGTWPIEGPPELWTRPLGGGYSAIVARSDSLYTMFRDGEQDVVIALRGVDGSTIWEHRYDAPLRSENQAQFGKGPNATPLLVGDRLITLGYTGVLKCLDSERGSVLWSYELIRDFDGEVLDFGYAASPILHDGKVIVLVGGDRQGVLALDPEDGSVAWSGPASSVSYATPIVIDVDGEEQLVYFSSDEIVGLDTSAGNRLWSFPVENQYRNNATGPLWGDDDLLWVATQLDGGTRALRLTREGDTTRVEEVWSTEKLSMHFWNALRQDDFVYASVGGNASVMVAVDVRTGRVQWRERGFQQANLLHAGDFTILLDEKGYLALVDLSPQGMTIRSQARIAEGPTWTVPTLVGTQLLVRDKKSIRAFQLRDV